jgi:hypothetical protein
MVIKVSWDSLVSERYSEKFLRRFFAKFDLPAGVRLTDEGIEFAEDPQLQDPTESACWRYTGNCRDGQHGGVDLDGKTHYSHCVMYDLWNRDLLQGSHVHHICHNPMCGNPAHLQQLTPPEHRAVTVRERQHAHGESHGHHKLTERQIISIYEGYFLDGMRITQLAQAFGMTPSAIHKIVSGRRWRNAYLDWQRWQLLTKELLPLLWQYLMACRNRQTG